MSKKPYMVQQDRPNLVIVPTDETCYKPPSKKVKLVSALPTPSQDYNSSAFAKKYSAKSNFTGVNNNVLIDVSKFQKPPTSWATNFLQSIGGSSTKFTKIYSSMPKSPTFRKNTQLENITEMTLPHITIPQTKTNTATNQPILEKNKSTPKININLIKTNPKPALQCTLAKEPNQPNSNTKLCLSTMHTSTNKTEPKTPSLPKNYKIPMHSKNKPIIQSVMDKECITKNGIKDQKSQPIDSSSKSNSDSIKVRQNKLMTRDTTPNKSNHSKVDPNQPKNELMKTMHLETNREKTNEMNQCKTNKIKVIQSTQNHTTKPKYDEKIIPPKSNKGTVQPTRNKENSQPSNKRVKEWNAVNETTQPKKHKDLLPSKCCKEITGLQTTENITECTNIKETYTISNKHEPTFSTKLKTKKEHIKVKSNKTSKTSKHSESKHGQENKSKKHKAKTQANAESNIPQSLLNNEKNITKIKKKRTPQKESAGTAEHSNSKDKKLKTNDANTTKKPKSRATNEERLSKSISPIKSVVSKIKSDTQSHNLDKRHKEPGCFHSHCVNESFTDSDYHCHNSQKPLPRGPDVDLRTKLKRKITKSDYRREDYKRVHETKKNKFATVANGDPFVPEENLIISFSTQDDNEEKVTMEKSPVKKLTRKQPSGGNKCKKIKLEINIVFDQADTTDDESVKGNDDRKDEPLENMDLSFLDDFNVDEIVASLNDCKDGSRKTNNVECLLVAEEQSSLSKETQEIEPMEISQNNLLLNNNVVQVKTEVCKEISSVEYKTENRETASHSTIKQSSWHSEEIHKGVDSGLSTIKKEAEIEPTELPQNDKFQETIVCMSDDKSSTTSLSNYTEVVKQAPAKNVNLLVTNTEQSEKTEITVDTKDIKPHLADCEILAHSTSTNIIHPDHKDLSDTVLQDNSKLEINSNKPVPASIDLTTNETSTITQHSHKIEKTEVKATGSASIQQLNGIFTCVKEEYITIEDSDSENETDIKNNQAVKHENTTDLHPDKESALDDSDDVIIIEPSLVKNPESILILDVDNIEENDNIKTQSNASVNLISATMKRETKIDLEDTVNQDSTVLADTTIEVKTNATAQIKSESEKKLFGNQVNKEVMPGIPKTEHSKVEKDGASNNVKVTNKPDSVTSDESSNRKTAETVPEKFTSGNTKQQNVNTLIDTKAPNKISPQDDRGNKDTNATSNEKVNRSQINGHFVQKAEEKLFFFLGRKCTVADVIRVGKYSKIYLCRDSRKQEFALKALKNECDGFRPRFKEQFQKEKMLMKLQNGVPENNLNCVRLINGFVICGVWCYLMEYYPKNLQQAFAENKRSFHIDDVQVLSRQLVSAVTILRNNNIIHSDIKPSHILINIAQTRIKLCGFDQSCYIGDSILLPNTGTVNYRAPELILGYPAGFGIDVWSTALVMYEMATNRKMFPGIYNNNILYQQLCSIGSIPLDMLMESKYRNTHFRDTSFTRIVGSNGERIIMDEISFNRKIENNLFKTYASEWGHGRGQAGRRNDKAKLSAFLKLLESMLVMHPRHRIAIEFVFANPFIYESFDNDF